jgi:Polyketide cyclase / dehydrase and lipid transport
LGRRVKHQFRAEDSGFATSAPKVLVFDAGVDASRDRVFEAIVAAPQAWKAWFPGITGGSYASPADQGVGATRFLGVAGTRVRETILVHEEPRRWAYRVDAASIPIAHAIVENWLFEELPDGTYVRWTFAIDPTVLFHLLLPFPRITIGAIWRRGMRNLSSHLQQAPY